jgi:hypothetical protein
MSATCRLCGGPIIGERKGFEQFCKGCVHIDISNDTNSYMTTSYQEKLPEESK